MNEELQSGPVIIPLSAYNVGFGGGGVSEEKVSTLITNTLNPIIDSIDELTSLNISTLALKTDVTSTSSTLNTKITSVSSTVSSTYALKTDILTAEDLGLSNYAAVSTVTNINNSLSSYALSSAVTAYVDQQIGNINAILETI